MQRSAVISDCGRYRYELRRVWEEHSLLEFIMLNPSTADAMLDDPTIRRCIAFAKRWGFGGLVVRNLYAYRATKPIDLETACQPIGPQNLDYLRRTDADVTVAAWGAHPLADLWRRVVPSEDVLYRNGSKMLCLGVNANGSPKHPLYVPSERKPVVWKGWGCLDKQ